LSKGTPVALAVAGVIALAVTAKENQAVPVADAASAPSATYQPAVATSTELDAARFVQTAAVVAPVDTGYAPDLVEVAIAKMSPTVAAHASAGGADSVPVIVRYDDAPELFENERVRRMGGEVVRRFDRLGLLAVKLPAGALVELAISDSVRRVSLDAPVQSTAVASLKLSAVPTDTLSASYDAKLDYARSLMPVHLQAVNAPVPSTHNDSFQGKRLTVAVVDSGVVEHDDLDDRVRQYDFTGGKYPQPEIEYEDGEFDEIDEYNSSSKTDHYGHGTLVAGAIAGDGDGSTGIKHRGLATKAKVLSLRVLDSNGMGVTSDAIAAMAWLAEYGQYFDVKVANLSIGKAVEESVETDPLVLAVEAVWDQGITVVVAAGNYGRDGNFTITSPGNSPKVITVGSLTDNATADLSDDYVSSYSSRGPSLNDHILKPDLIAPGNKVVSTIPGSATLKSVLSQNLVACDKSGCDDDYLEMSGTSMAAPLVSATVLKMYEKHSNLTPDTAKARLMRTARGLSLDATASGAGVLNVEAAMNDLGVPSNAVLSPKMVRATNADVIAVQNTGVLWGGAEWSNANIWADGYLWSDQDIGAYGFLWSDETLSQGFLWSDEVGSYGYLWSDQGIGALGFLWSDEGIGAQGFLWSQGYLWSDVVSGVNALGEVTAAGDLNDD
ncbi:MAG: S8 family serine peptidase, partial [Pseudomonadota bacterium]